MGRRGGGVGRSCRRARRRFLLAVRSPALHESAADLARLQEQLDRSASVAGPHLAGMFAGDDRLSAAELVSRVPGVIELHLAVTTSDGAPLVAPVDALFFRGRVWFSLPAASVRTQLLRRDGRVSASYADGSFGLIVHGTATAVEAGSDEEAAFTSYLVDCYVAKHGDWWRDWFEERRREEPPSVADADPGFTGWIEPRRIYAKG